MSQMQPQTENRESFHVDPPGGRANHHGNKRHQRPVMAITLILIALPRFTDNDKLKLI